jgi:hypothetical protein
MGNPKGLLDLHKEQSLKIYKYRLIELLEFSKPLIHHFELNILTQKQG